MATILDIAKEAGVSAATVSRVINKTGPVAESTERRVRAVVERYHYKPNALGKSLRTKNSNMVLIFVPNISNPFYAEIIRGADECAHAHHYNTMLCITGRSKNLQHRFFELLYSHQADGAIVMDLADGSGTFEKVAQNYPVVQCGEYCIDKGVSRITIDNFAAARQTTKYLLSIGHRRIAFLGADNGAANPYSSSAQRLAGYKQALKEADVPFRPQYLAYANGDYSFGSAVVAANRLLSRKEPPTAIVCVADILAIGVVRAAQQHGMQVPRDLSVTGFDDVEYATMMDPPLTTVEQPCYRLGETACSMLLRRMAGGEPEQVQLDHQLVLRQSTAEFTPKP